jgi:hypothetical protein
MESMESEWHSISFPLCDFILNADLHFLEDILCNYLQIYFAGTYHAEEWNRAGKFVDLNVSDFFPPISPVVLS